MTLQETAFMINLIKSNYRRRMTNFMFNIFALLLPATIYIYLEGNLTISQIIVLALTTCAALWRITIVYFEKDDIGYGLPWQIKKRQVIALNENKDAPFDEMRSSVRLQEYFFI